MFRIGEFSKIAQVSARLLRHYDQLGLFRPAGVDQQNGYRFYQAEQLPQLNRILVLKELGLSLEQVGQMLADEISADEIRGMLLLQRAQAAQSLGEEEARLVAIEARLGEIERAGTLEDLDVKVKTVAERWVISTRERCHGFEHGSEIIAELVASVRPQLDERNVGELVSLSHSEDFEMDDIDLEIGFLLKRRIDRDIPLSGHRRVAQVRELPAVGLMATTVQVGSPQDSQRLTVPLGYWMEANRYRVAGPTREVFLQLPSAPDRLEELVVEMQWPLERIENSSIN